MAALVCGLIWVCCLGWSWTSAVGFVSLNHQKVVDGADKTKDAWGDAKAKMERLNAQRQLVPVHRELSIVKSDIETKRGEPQFDATDNCRDPRAPKAVAFCQQYRGLLAEEASAGSAIKLDTEIEKLRIERDGRTAVSVVDPLSITLAKLTSSASGDISMFRSWAFASFLELISALGLWAVWNSRGDEKLIKPRKIIDITPAVAVAIAQPQLTADTPAQIEPPTPEKQPKKAKLKAVAGTKKQERPFLISSNEGERKLSSLSEAVALIAAPLSDGRHYYADLHPQIADVYAKPHRLRYPDPAMGKLIARHLGVKGRRDGKRGNATFYELRSNHRVQAMG